MTRSRDRAAGDHGHRVAAMFDVVAPRYDFLNRVLSLGRDRAWRRRAVELARLGPDEVALDLGVGTGDLALALLARSDATARVVGVDLSDAMLARVRERASATPLAERLRGAGFARVRYERLNFGTVAIHVAER